MLVNRLLFVKVRFPGKYDVKPSKRAQKASPVWQFKCSQKLWEILKDSMQPCQSHYSFFNLLYESLHSCLIGLAVQQATEMNARAYHWGRQVSYWKNEPSSACVISSGWAIGLLLLVLFGVGLHDSTFIIIIKKTAKFKVSPNQL